MMPRRLRRGRGEPPEEREAPQVLAQADEEARQIVERALPYTMTGAARVLALVDATRYCTARDIPGAFVECGVWRGGSVLAMVLTLQALGVDDRDIYLYDTFEGMTAPTKHDVSDIDPPALQTWQQAQREERPAWNELFAPELFNEESVRNVVTETGYPAGRLHFVRGPVEQIVAETMPDQISLLRLDTDWYESTRHELTHLFPVLQAGGVLIIDDYGHWQGARRAVDEYFSAEHPPLMLNRIDYTGRIAIKH